MHASTFANAGSPVNNPEVVHRINSNQSSPLKGTLKAKARCCKNPSCRRCEQTWAGPGAPSCYRLGNVKAFPRGADLSRVLTRKKGSLLTYPKYTACVFPK